MAWSETSSDFAFASVRGWEMWPGPILAFAVAWLVLPVIVIGARVSARWVVPLGVIQAVWAFRSAQGLEATGMYWFSPRTNVGSGPHALAIVGIVAAAIALSIRRPSAWDEPNEEPD
jgi:hypothetical protein